MWTSLYPFGEMFEVLQGIDSTNRVIHYLVKTDEVSLPGVHPSFFIEVLKKATWWLIPLSKWVITPVISGLTLLIPLARPGI
jgi:hypothetical protein